MKIIIDDETTPYFKRVIGFPPPKIKEVLENDDAAISLARSIAKKYEQIEGTKYWETHKGHRYYFDIGEKNQAMKEIMENFSFVQRL